MNINRKYMRLIMKGNMTTSNCTNFQAFTISQNGEIGLLVPGLQIAGPDFIYFLNSYNLRTVHFQDIVVLSWYIIFLKILMLNFY